MPKFRAEREVEDRVKRPGVSVGLVWTPAGGDIVFIEATRMRGGKQFTMTGHLGEVMQESMTAALNVGACQRRALRRHRSRLLPQAGHPHPRAFEGAVPKDGPSWPASRWLTRWLACSPAEPLRPRVAMTGEISLSFGIVLPVGGIRRKVLGAEGARNPRR